MEYLPQEPVNPAGYKALHFAFHPGTAVIGSTERFSVRMNQRDTHTVQLMGVQIDINVKDWQVVEVLMEAFNLGEGWIESISLSGNLRGVFYLDDIRLVADTPPPATAVLEERDSMLPQSFALEQNFPNPFNGSTMIHFALPANEEVELAVYNLMGQKVATLVEGAREAGIYTIHWDGRDVSGRALATGVYLYRLQAGAQTETRKLLLLR